MKICKFFVIQKCIATQENVINSDATIARHVGTAPQKKVQPQVVQTIQTLESILKSKELELTNKESSLEGEKNRLANLFNSLEEAKDLKFGFDKKIKEISDNLF